MMMALFETLHKVLTKTNNFSFSLVLNEYICSIIK